MDVFHSSFRYTSQEILLDVDSSLNPPRVQKYQSLRIAKYETYLEFGSLATWF